MKKIVVITTVILVGLTTFFACQKKSQDKKDTRNNSVITESIEPYKLQAPFVNLDVDGVDNFTQFYMDNDLLNLIKSSTTTWETFDELFNNPTKNFTQIQKQYLAYVILVKKDLIGYVKNNAENTTATGKLKDYVTVLTESKYIGYCTLYFALKSLQTSQETFVHNSAQTISTNSAGDEFTADMNEEVKTNFDTYDEKGKATLNKYKDNYSYLEKIKTEF